MTEVNVNLNAHELGIIVQLLENLSASEEKLLAKDYGSVSSLHSRLYEIWKTMDHSSLNLRYDFTPYF